MKGLTNNQKRFCQEYVKLGMNGTRAYMKAYKTCKKEETAMVNASKLLRNAKVKTYIEKLQQKTEDKAIMDIKERMKWLTKVINGEITNNIGDSEYEPYVADKMKAVDLLNKMDGIYINNHKVSGDENNPLKIDLSHLTTEEIRKLLEDENKE